MHSVSGLQLFTSAVITGWISLLSLSLPEFSRPTSPWSGTHWTGLNPGSITPGRQTYILSKCTRQMSQFYLCVGRISTLHSSNLYKQELGIHKWSRSFRSYCHEDINNCVRENRMTCRPDNWYRNINVMVVSMKKLGTHFCSVWVDSLPCVLPFCELAVGSNVKWDGHHFKDPWLLLNLSRHLWWTG